MTASDSAEQPGEAFEIGLFLRIGTLVDQQVAQVELALFIFHPAVEQQLGVAQAQIAHRSRPTLVEAGQRVAAAVLEQQLATPLQAAAQHPAGADAQLLALQTADIRTLAGDQAGGDDRDHGDDQQRADDRHAALVTAVHGALRAARSRCRR